jgi:hypothetical protein
LIFLVRAILLVAMRALLPTILLLAVVFSGCTRKKPAPSPTPGSPRAGAKTAPSNAALTSEVIRINPIGRFVVLSFALDHMPPRDQRLNLYRHGAKVAEVKVAGPQRGNNIVADIVSGAPEVGDEARPD